MINIIQDILKENRLDAVIVNNLYDILYLLDIKSSFNFVEASPILIITKDKNIILGDSFSLSKLTLPDWVKKKEITIKEFLDNHFSHIPTLSRFLKSSNLSSIGLFEDIPLEGVEITMLDNPIEKRLNTYTGERLERLKGAVSIVKKVLENTFPKIKEGMREIDLRNIIDALIYDIGADKRAFPTKVGFGKNTAHPSPVSNAKMLEIGDVLLIDFGIIKDGIGAEIIRSYAFKKLNSEVEKVAEVITTSMERGINFTKPGRLTSKLDEAVRNYIQENGYAENFFGISGEGLTPRKSAISISPYDRGILKPNIAFVLQPAAYIPNQFGIKIKNIIYITDTGGINLTDFYQGIDYLCSS